jgi:glycerophosphoryl diester phosphodiesterase
MPEQNTWLTLSGDAPLVIAHRGASGYRPEHTLAAYDLAIDMGADFIEPDLVITKDGQLITRHDRYLSSTTDVASRPEFADRKVEKAGHDGEDWFVEDFTLAEIKTLRARQPRAERGQQYDGIYEVPTFTEVLEMLKKHEAETGRRIGVYPETKHPAALEALGLSYDTVLLQTLREYGYNGKAEPVFIQSFESENLKRLRGLTDIRLVYLTATTPDMSLIEIAKFAGGIGPNKKLLIDTQGQDTGFVKAAHGAGLTVHPWTFRDDVPDSDFSDKPSQEIPLISTRFTLQQHCGSTGIIGKLLQHRFSKSHLFGTWRKRFINHLNLRRVNGHFAGIAVLTGADTGGF